MTPEYSSSPLSWGLWARAEPARTGCRRGSPPSAWSASECCTRNALVASPPSWKEKQGEAGGNVFLILLLSYLTSSSDRSCSLFICSSSLIMPSRARWTNSAMANKEGGGQIEATSPYKITDWSENRVKCFGLQLQFSLMLQLSKCMIKLINDHGLFARYNAYIVCCHYINQMPA